MNRIIMIIMACGALIGGVDRIINNRFGLGEKFEEGFRLLGTIGLSMAGVISLVPVISVFLGKFVAPLLLWVGIDPAILGSVLAIDMGGYLLAMDLTITPEIGKFAGTVVAAIFGCTIVFTIPVGMGMMDTEAQNYFSKGLLYGLIVMPIAFIVGGLAAGLSLFDILWNCIPVLAISAFLLVGIVKFLPPLIKGFRVLAKTIQIIGTVGLILGAVQHMTGWILVENLTPLQESMSVVTGICIVMLGSMPVAELIKRALNRPFMWIQKKTGMNTVSTTGLIAGTVSVTLALVMMKDMDKRGKIVCASFVVSSAGVFAAHLGSTISLEPSMVGPVLLAKLTGGILGVIVSLICTRGMKEST